jgi:uncharacterized protein (TIGR02301 family)
VRPLLIAAALALALPAAAAEPPPRSPVQRQTLVDLAYTLGEAHALRTACLGADDQVWRGRMSRVIEVERPDDPFRRRLVDAFNSGFVTGQARNPTCRETTTGEERAAARRGRDLAGRLAAGIR